MPGDRQNLNQLTDLAGSGWSTGRNLVRGRSTREANTHLNGPHLRVRPVRIRAKDVIL
jgi:hypothetical protein